MAASEPSAAPPLDAARIGETLDRHGVAYVIVGGMAGRLHGASRITYDLDVLAGAACPMATCRRGAIASDVGGVAVRIASLPDLITAKRSADRAKDHDALPEIKALRDAGLDRPADPEVGP